MERERPHAENRKLRSAPVAAKRPGQANPGGGRPGQAGSALVWGWQPRGRGEGSFLSLTGEGFRTGEYTSSP